MKRFQSILFASVLTVALSSTALAGDISGKPGNISGKPGNISGKPGNISGKPGNISGLPNLSEYIAIMLATIIG